MKIIDVGVCVNNNDPMGIGRIRYRPFGSIPSEIEKSIPYEDWDRNDQFVALPFLPPHINIIPQVQQSVKIIKYDTDKDTQNVEYIVGPFSSPHNFGSETYTTQHRYTTYGDAISNKRPGVRDEKTGGYVDKKSEGSIPNLTDNGLSGNYGSDVIFTENGVMIRGGKLLSKSYPNKRIAQKLLDIPMISDKMSKISLKKFPKKMEMKTEITEVEQIVVGKINYVVEYELDSLLTPTTVKFFVYKVKNSYGRKFDTDYFSETTDILPEEVQLISVGGSTFTASYTGSSLNVLEPAARTFLQKIHIDGLSKINSKYPSEDIHPFYFRPTSNFREIRPTNPIEINNKSHFLNNVKLHRAGPKNGIYFSANVQWPPTKIVPVTTKKLEVVNQTEEQTFATTSSDYIYLLSTIANKGEKDSIDFTKLNKYEYTQDNLLGDINPNTYALVRGETLINLLKLMYSFLTEHKHNLNDKPLYKPEITAQLDMMMATLQTSLINQSIRIN